MASPTDIRKGRVILYQGVPHLVLEMQHRTQGRGSGWVQTTLRNLKSGSSTTNKFRSTDTVEFLMTETTRLEFSYDDGHTYTFMDPDTFETVDLNAEMVEDAVKYLVPNNNYDILYVDGKPAQVVLPASVEMKVIESAEGIRGDTASNVQKPAKMETGLVVQVPLFIKEGEVLKISTTDGSYLGRA